MIRCLDDFIPAIQQRESRRIAIATAEEVGIIKLVKLCLEKEIAEFILIGDQPQIEALLREHDLNDPRLQLINKPDHREAAMEAVNQVVAGNAQVVMKGNLHTSVFLKAVLNKETGLGNGKLISQITVYDKMDGSGLQMITDCAMNIAPNLDEKRQIIENAVVDGPFALDNAISAEAAEQKGLKSEVAGHADIILAPNLHVGNALHKALTYLAQKRLTTAITGADTPIVMTSRTDPVDVKLLSVAIATYISK